MSEWKDGYITALYRVREIANKMFHDSIVLSNSVNEEDRAAWWRAQGKSEIMQSFLNELAALSSKDEDVTIS